ncbi:SIMPL domain-containing protein [Phenylobacterium sp.]|uniref:SIMPL domain-containing protein n=1 Tax=Phenylobacterium sp. TaxID=1871053 RepID=UPI0025EC00B1|nr:SIMPL domain-containing protein [Phenylobacterium sp.]MBX3485781.1 SIMPL domain-containing protein [Phenylobacterium sp.]MCW5759913.1 SIMPL domain-containing protein [Phenylobacterium sp.]
MKTFLRAGALALAFSAASAPAALAQAAPPVADTLFKATTLNLSAYGETRVAPDMATIALGVMTEGKTAAEAMQANAARMATVMASLRKAGIADKDIQTSNLNLNPQYRYQENQPPLLVGYQASNNVTITVHDLKRLGAAVDASVGAGANQVNGVAFGLDDPTAAENAAREAAVKALAAKADLYARATGHRISRLVSLSEGGGYSAPPPMPMERFAMPALAKDAGTPISGGELKVRIDVSGLYELTR